MIKSIFKFNKRQVIFVLLIIIISGIVYFIKKAPFLDQWANWIDPLSALSIIIISIFVWFNEQKKNYIERLPKKLDVIYMEKKGNDFIEHCRIENAPLSSEADIRSWGQSLAQTVISDKIGRIDFIGFETSAGKLDKKQRVYKYTHTIYLEKPFTITHKNYIYDVKGKSIKRENLNKNPNEQKTKSIDYQVKENEYYLEDISETEGIKTLKKYNLCH